VTSAHDEGLADRELLAWVTEHGHGPVTFDVVQARAEGRARALARDRAPALSEVTDLEISPPGCPLAMRLYEPEGADERVIVYLHGGMWMLGDLETHDRTSGGWRPRRTFASLPSTSGGHPSIGGRRRLRTRWRRLPGPTRS